MRRIALGVACVMAMATGMTAQQPRTRQTTPDEFTWNLAELCEEWLSVHSAERTTLDGYRARLVSARAKFGKLRIDRLDPTEIGRWRRTLPERSAHAYHKALRQVLAYAVVQGLRGRELAAALGIAEGAARVRLSRAVGRLKQAYRRTEAAGGEGPGYGD